MFNAAVLATTGQNGFGRMKGDRGDSFDMTLKNFAAARTIVPRKMTVRVTIEFTQESIEFLKRETKNHNDSYQAMIRNLVDTYAKQQQQ